MDDRKLADMAEVFEGLENWRNAQQTRHRLSELLTVAVCAVLSGADDFEEISQWGVPNCRGCGAFFVSTMAWPLPTPLSASSRCSIRSSSNRPFAPGWAASSRRWVKTHMFFDDQETHVQAASSVVPAGKVPYEGGSLRAANRKTSTDLQQAKAEIKEKEYLPS